MILDAAKKVKEISKSVSSQHKDMHSLVSKVGKSIDKVCDWSKTTHHRWIRLWSFGLAICVRVVGSNSYVFICDGYSCLVFNVERVPL